MNLYRLDCFVTVAGEEESREEVHVYYRKAETLYDAVKECTNETTRVVAATELPEDVVLHNPEAEAEETEEAPVEEKKEGEEVTEETSEPKEEEVPAEKPAEESAE